MSDHDEIHDQSTIEALQDARGLSLKDFTARFIATAMPMIPYEHRDDNTTRALTEAAFEAFCDYGQRNDGPEACGQAEVAEWMES
jgi:hypothetical protein